MTCTCFDQAHLIGAVQLRTVHAAARVRWDLQTLRASSFTDTADQVEQEQERCPDKTSWGGGGSARPHEKLEGLTWAKMASLAADFDR